MSVSDIASAFEAELAFTREEDIGPDAERAGLLRARTLAPKAQESQASYDLHTCRILDWGAAGSLRPDLLRNGFECVELPSLAGLRAVLEKVRAASHLSREDAGEIRRQLTGRFLRLGDGSRVRMHFIAPEGFIMRKAGPNGLPVSPHASRSEMNDHDAAGSIHADQDVLGTPLRQMMRGAAPWLFRHEAPDSRNRWSPLLLLNLWIPLQQITRPLVLMDKRSLDRRAQQLRYGLPTDDFLNRDADRRVNDIWTFRHHPEQQWYFHPELHADRAYLFETLGTPHGACIVPGEERAEQLWRQLDSVSAAIRSGDADALRAVESGRETDTAVATLPLRRAIGSMEELLREARENADSLCAGAGAEDWCARAEQAQDAVVRKSLEMRVVALRVPGFRLGRG